MRISMCTHVHMCLYMKSSYADSCANGRCEQAEEGKRTREHAETVQGQREEWASTAEEFKCIE